MKKLDEKLKQVSWIASYDYSKKPANLTVYKFCKLQEIGIGQGFLLKNYPHSGVQFNCDIKYFLIYFKKNFQETFNIKTKKTTNGILMWRVKSGIRRTSSKQCSNNSTV